MSFPRNLGLLLVMAVVVAGGATVASGVPQALATNEGFSCGPCAATNGNENWIKNVEGANSSGKGLCNTQWQDEHTSGGPFYNLYEECTATRSTLLICGNQEEWGHGEVRRYYSEYLYYLGGRQDNYKTCG